MQNVVMPIPAAKINSWQKALANHGMKSHIARESGLTRVTIDMVIKKGRARKGTIDRIDRAIQNAK